MKTLLAYKSFYTIFVALLLFCFIGKSFAEESVEQGNSTQKNADELKAFVETGLKYIKKYGEEKAYREFNNPKGKFRKGQQYIFVFGFNGKVLAHGGDPKFFVGKNLFSVKDEFGTSFFQLFVEAANNGGGLVNYYWPRPDTGVLQYKTSYIAPINDRAFIGAGVYKDLEVQELQELKINELKKFVESGVAYIKQKGTKEAYKDFNDPKGAFVKKDCYLFVVGYNGEVLAHGGDPKKMVGTNISNLKDEVGTPLLTMFIEAAKNGGGVVNYNWPHYIEAGKVRFKTSYILPIDKNILIGGGYYEDYLLICFCGCKSAAFNWQNFWCFS